MPLDHGSIPRSLVLHHLKHEHLSGGEVVLQVAELDVQRVCKIPQGKTVDAALNDLFPGGSENPITGG